jgi:phosphoribosyl 1,2-cyclic phosphodiesterase
MLERAIFALNMSLFVASLNSGSNGNCYYIGTGNEAVLIDAGISCREIEKRMRRLQLHVNSVRAVFVSHEHGDHIHGASALSKKHQIPVYITHPTLAASTMDIDPAHAFHFTDEVPVAIGNMVITPFSKHHDAIDPYSFVISHQQVSVGVFTDIGHSCSKVVNYFSQCHAVFLEANYDEMMLEQGRYPLSLKNRIRNGRGHLSNRQAAQLFTHHRPAFMSHLFLSHLSRNNNTPEVAREAFASIDPLVEIHVAPRYHESELFYITGNPSLASANRLSVKKSERPVQLSLF